MVRLILFLLLQSILLFCISCPVVTLSITPFHSNDTDKLALLAFKSGINSQGIMLSWNNSIPFCEWEGVRCSLRHQRVITLNLSSQGLTGTISPYIGNLSFMKTLNLTNNNFHGEIPQEIGRLVRLQELYMGNNSFSGQIPVNLSQCSNLVSLILHQNKLTGKIHEEFGFFSKLTKLSLYRNILIGGIPASLGNLSSLKHLSISENSLTGSIPDSFGQYRRLSFLTVTANMLSGMVPPSLYNITSLKVLSLSVNRLNGQPPQDIGQKLSNLKTFFIGENQFSGSIPVSLFTNTSELVAVSFGNNSFTGEVPLEVGKAKSLELFVVQDNYLGSGGELDDIKFLTSLSNCTNLVKLDIPLNHLGGRLPSSISNLSQSLFHLDLGENQIFGSIPSSIGELKGLIYFAVPSNILTGEIPFSIGMLQNLQNVVLKRNNLSGRIPYSIGNISSLYSLDLSYNSLEGSIVTSLGRCRSLQELSLDHNLLTGVVSKQVIGLSTQLTNINLSHNFLTGSLPSEVGSLKNLHLFDVSVNKISGEIPSTLGNCFILESLHLQDNFLQGSIPATFQYLKGIQDINISRNNLSGKIPKDLENLFYLKTLDLSFNKLEGEVPMGGIFQNVSAFSIVGNNKLCGGATKLKLPKCYKERTNGKVMSPALKVILGVLLPSLVILPLFLVLYLRRKPKPIPTFQELTHNLPRISYAELHDATQGFSPQTMIGTGSYGSVYKGVLQNYASPIAVKVLKLEEKGASKSFVNECEILRGVRHRNLLKIVTVCSSIDFEGNDFKALILEFMPNGSLENWLYPNSNRSQQGLKRLNLVQRLNIATDVAYALDYLHNQCETPIVHCDLKPSNILLDNDMVAYVGDFGLAKFLPKNTRSSDESGSSAVAIRGTIGYIPPEYGMGGDASTHGDMYSYGILLLEMFTGKRPTDAMFNENISLHSICKQSSVAQVMEILHTDSLLAELQGESTNNKITTQRDVTNQMKEALISIIEIGVNCSLEAINARMNIKDVLTKILKVNELFCSQKNV